MLLQLYGSEVYQNDRISFYINYDSVNNKSLLYMPNTTAKTLATHTNGGNEDYATIQNQFEESPFYYNGVLHMGPLNDDADGSSGALEVENLNFDVVWYYIQRDASYQGEIAGAQLFYLVYWNEESSRYTLYEHEAGQWGEGALAEVDGQADFCFNRLALCFSNDGNCSNSICSSASPYIPEELEYLNDQLEGISN